MQKDNTTLKLKAALRISLLKHLREEPIVLETHGGLGRVFLRVYPKVQRGIVFEVDPTKAEVLCRQRPTWSVYQGKVEDGLDSGLAAHLTVNLVDLDPYGEPWPALDAFFRTDRPRSPRLAVAVNDGLRQKLRLQGGWSVRSMREAVERWGNAPLCDKYLAVCRWKLERLAALQGYRLTHWTGYHCGHNNDMTHYAAILEQRARRRRRPALKAAA